MGQETLAGKKCPDCSSFIKSGETSCNICGFKFPVAADKVQAEITGQDIICPKCGTSNLQIFKFCKICKFPFVEDNWDHSAQEKTMVTDIKKLIIRFDWITIPKGFEKVLKLNLIGFDPYFKGYADWFDYVFFVYRAESGYEILSRKVRNTQNTFLFKKTGNVLSCASGSSFYLGSTRFQVLGDLKENIESKTQLCSDKTLLIGPGEKIEEDQAQNQPRLKIFSADSKNDFRIITEKTVIGRRVVSEWFGQDEEKLRQNGLSREHINLIPMPEQRWEIEPVAKNKIYFELGSTPEKISSGEIMRAVINNRLAEFGFSILEE